MARIAVALSGGVDSAVAGHLLMEAGHDVVGVTMRLTDDVRAVRAARQVADALGITHRVVDLRSEFETLVVGPFCEAYAAGLTPSPCIGCNESVKFGLLLEDVIAHGSERLATGHYARVGRSRGAPVLRTGADAGKDQSYFLYRLGITALEHAEFPLGSLEKESVRRLASEVGLPMAEAGDSQETCFAPDGEHQSVVASRCPEAVVPGPIIDQDGTVVGSHQGLAAVTIGKRRGLGIGGGPPQYVTDVDAASNTVRVGPREALITRTVTAGSIVWHGAEVEGRCTFRYRHGRHTDEGTFELRDGVLVVESAADLWGVAPGQSLVCYKGDAVLGGGVIARG